MYKEHLAYAQTPERTASILTDEASATHKGLLYKEVFPNDKSWYSSNIVAELGDLVTMTLLLCEQLDLDINEVREIGYKRFLVRMEELKKGRQE